MKAQKLALSLLLFAALWPSRAAERADIFAHTNLVAWCIVPFDAKKRGSEERATMLDKLGIKRFAYDWRAEQVPTFETEVETLQRHGIELTAWWFPGTLNDDAKKILSVLERRKIKAQLWVMGGGGPVKDVADQRARVEAEANRIRPIAEAAAKIGCTVGLYNHGGWFGEPENQLAIIEKLRLPNVGIIYNFHHGHDHVARFPELWRKMQPHLLAVNLNGMARNGDKQGKKILVLGQGDDELAMMRVIRDSGWRGPVGILNHTGEDAETRLKANLDGLDWLLKELDKPGSGGPRPKVAAEVTRRTDIARANPPTHVGGYVTDGRFGNALDASVSGVTVAGNATYRQPPLTAEAWVKLNSKKSFNIILASDTKLSAAHWEMFTWTGTGTLTVYMPGMSPNHVRSQTNICDGRWHYVAMVYEPARMRLFVDGKQVADQAVKSKNDRVVPGGLAIGRLVEGGPGCDGLVDDVRLSRGVRAVDRVPNAPLAADAATIGLWNFDAQNNGGFDDASPLKNRAMLEAPSVVQLWTADAPTQPPLQLGDLVYMRSGTREAAEQASLEATAKRLATYKLSAWHTLSPVEVRPSPSGLIDMEADYKDIDGKPLQWADATKFADGQWNDVSASIGWAYRTIEAERDQDVTLIVGVKSPALVRFNGEQLGWLTDKVGTKEPVAFPVRLKRGPNHFYIHVNEANSFSFEISALNDDIRAQLNKQLALDYGTRSEDNFYRLETVNVPSNIVLEVGGLGCAPDGAIMIATRRGEIWALKKDKWSLFASGLHEPMGLLAGKRGEVFVLDRYGLARIADTDGDGRADLFETINDECGVSHSGHAYIYGPVRDSKGNFWGVISGLGATDDGKYFGWCFKITPERRFVPVAGGFRSPNSIAITPDDDVFIGDNQGNYVPTSPLHHVVPGAFYGFEPAMRYDPSFKDNLPIEKLTALRKPPAVQFTYGPMGQSLSQPLVDTTAGKFGPFAGQMFIADHTKCSVMRVVLHKVGGEFQGACFPFRSGFQSGNNRMCWVLDGSLYVGQTVRGWGSIGGRSYGLQRLVWTGRVPMEIYSMKLTSSGFELEFTKPVDANTAGTPSNYSLQHYYYIYRPEYGSPQMDITPVQVTAVKLSEDRKRVWLTVPHVLTGKIYELHLNNIRAADGSDLLHPVGYYTVNRLVKE